MRGGPARLAIIAAAIVVGIFVLAKAFDGTTLAVPVPDGKSPTPTVSPTTTAGSPTPTPTPTHKPTCKVQGVSVAIYNASNTNGLAAATQRRLENAGYRIPNDPATAPATQQTTLLYYRSPQDKVEAGCLIDKFFKGADLKKLLPGSGVPKNVQVAVFLGTDYAAKHPVK